MIHYARKHLIINTTQTLACHKYIYFSTDRNTSFFSAYLNNFILTYCAKILNKDESINEIKKVISFDFIVICPPLPI